jgi:hypothetical protein
MQLVGRQDRLSTGPHVSRLGRLIEITRSITYEPHALPDQQTSAFRCIGETREVVAVRRLSESVVFDPVNPQLGLQEQFDRMEVQESHRIAVEPT